MSRQYLINLYLDFVNNWLTVESFAEFHEISEGEFAYLLKLGRKYHNEYADMMGGE